MQKIRIIGFFFQNRLHWQFEVGGKKNFYKRLFRLHIYLHTIKTVIHNSLHVFEIWGKNVIHRKMEYNYSTKMFTRKATPIRITSFRIIGFNYIPYYSRSQWPRDLKCGFAAARLLGLWVRIPPGVCLSLVSVVCCQVEVSATGLSLVQRSPTDCVCVWVWSWILDKEEALALQGFSRLERKKGITRCYRRMPWEPHIYRFDLTWFF